MPKVPSCSLPFLVGRNRRGSGVPTCCNRDPFVALATLEVGWDPAQLMRLERQCANTLSKSVGPCSPGAIAVCYLR
jgi:hypothetical protein